MLVIPEVVWRYLYHDVFGGNEFYLAVFGSFLVDFCTFWTISVFLMYPDLTGKPAWFQSYKVQPGTNKPVDKSRLRTTIKDVLFNDFLVTIPFLVLMYPAQRALGCGIRPDELPSVFKVLFDIPGLILFDEVVFYYTHRAFHWGPLYVRFHKRHHEWTAPVGVVAKNAHPVEHLFCNLPTKCLGSVLLGTHLLEFWIWIFFVQYVTVFHHSGYKFPHLPDPGYHDHHHMKFNGNYGGGMLDRFHGTDIGKYDGKPAETKAK